MIEQSDLHDAISTPSLSSPGGWKDRRLTLRRQADPPPHANAIRVGLQPRGVNAVDREFLVPNFGVAGHPDRADDLAFVVTDQHATALREDLIAARGNEVSHEDRPLLCALANELRAAAERQRRISLPIGHFET